MGDSIRVGIVTGMFLLVNLIANNVRGKHLESVGGKAMPPSLPHRIVYDTDGDGEADRTDSYVAMRNYCRKLSREPTQSERDWYRNKK